MRPGALSSIVVLVALGGCQSAPPAPYLQMPEHAQLSAEERSIWRDAEDFDRRLEGAGARYRDGEAEQYVQRVMDRLYPEFGGRLRVRLLKAPTLNAFALPNGVIYVHIGLLARLKNEAQLATVLGHEGIHFIHRHSLQQHESVKMTSAVLQASFIAGPVAGLLGASVAAPALYGYSRELERDADAAGYERLVRAGYDASEAPKTFEHLAAEVKAYKIDEPLVYGSHPKLAERIENLRAARRDGTPRGELGAEAFLAATRSVRLAALEGDLARGRYQSVILVLEDETARAQYPLEASYFLGEAYRQRAGADDAARSERAYLAAIEATPRFAPPYRALGIRRLKLRDYAGAKFNFDRYLELAPHAPDRSYVESYRLQAIRESEK